MRRVSLSIIPGDKSPDEEDCRGGLWAELQAYSLNVTPATRKERDMSRASLFTYDSARGLSLERCLATTSASEPEPYGRDTFPLLGASTSKSSDAVLFLP